MNRHELRERVFRLLFRVEFNSPEDMPEQIRLFCEDEEYGTYNEEDSKYVTTKYENVLDKLSEIDDLINENATGWDTKRMGKVDVTVIRLATYEMIYDDDIPYGVAMDEAVELAKAYGQDNSGAFVNAVLTKIKNAKGIS